MGLIQLHLLFPSSSINLNQPRLIYIKNWLVENNWITPSQFSHPHIIRLFQEWEEWLKVPANDNQHYDRFKKIFIEQWGAKWWDELLIYTYFFHPTYWLIENNVKSQLRHEESN